MTAQITRVMPREQVGPQTGRKYEFQYEEAALACLDLLKEDSAACVYCEWHDDYVVEHGEAANCTYIFHQVKTRADTKGAWSMFEVLGVTKPAKEKPKPAKAAAAKAPLKPPKQPKLPQPPRPTKLALRERDSIAIRMLDHYRKFKDACAMFVLVTPTDVTNDPMLDLVAAAKSCSTPDKLMPEQNALFQGLLNAHQQRDPSVTAEELWALVKRLNISIARASEPEAKVAVGLMGQLIYDLSEVDVSITEQARIATDLMKEVRDRSHTVLKVLPSDDEVRLQKSMTIREVIKKLPLSFEGWERLRRGETTAVRTLSRLQRKCKRAGMSDALITNVCDLKLTWQDWRARVGDTLTRDMLGVLRESGLRLLRDLTTGTSSKPFQDLQASADVTAEELGKVTRMPGGLTGAIVMGLVFALAAESE